MKERFLPFHQPSVTRREISAAVEALEEGWISSGPRVVEFERAFAEAVGAAHAVAVNSGTSALHLALESSGVGPGDEVIVPDMTFTATAAVVVHLGARPVIVDCSPDTLMIDPPSIESAIGEHTKAILPVHYGGQACDLDSILEIAASCGAVVVEDAAHAFPASYNGRKIGSIGDLTVFSFYATKTLAVGEGGMLTTDDSRRAERAKIMRLHGMALGGESRSQKEGTWQYDVMAAGYKCNLPEPQAAIGLVQLERQQEMLERRTSIAERYLRGLEGEEAIQLPEILPGRQTSWHLFVIRLRNEMLSIDRDGFISGLKSRNIGTSVHFTPLHRHSFYRKTFDLSPGDFPGAEDAFHRIVSLPIWPDMRDRDVERVIESVRDVIDSCRR